MPQVDGDIKLTATLTPGDIKKTAQQLKNELSNALDVKSTEKLSAQMLKLQASISKNVDTANKLQQQLESLEQVKVPTEEYQRLQAEIQGATEGLAYYQKDLEKLHTKFPRPKFLDDYEKIVQLRDEAKEFIANISPDQLKVDPDLVNDLEEAQNKIKGWQAYIDKASAQYNALLKEDQTRIKKVATEEARINQDIAADKQRILDIQTQITELEQSGAAYVDQTQTEKYKQLAASLNQVNNQLVVQKAQVEEIGIKEQLAKEKQAAKIQELEEKEEAAHQKRVERERELIRKRQEAFEKSKRNSKEEVKEAEKATEAQEKHANAVKKVSKEHKSASFSLEGFGKSLKKGLMMILRYGLGIRGLFALFRKLRNAVKEGFENLQNFSEPLKESVSEMKASFSTVKNSIASAFAPVAERFIPLITQAASRLTELFNNVARYVAILFNKPTYTKAVAVQSDYAKALNNTKKAAESARNALAGFDELTVVNTENSSEAADATEEAAGMFELVETATGAGSPFGKFGELLEDIWGKVLKIGDIGKKFGEFLSQLDFGPITTALSQLWGVLSPIIDEIIGDADWFREHVFQPLIKFLVEKGIPGAIDLIRVAIDNIWKVFKPFKDGIKQFWEDNGDWISELLESSVLQSFDKIKEAFGKIGDFFEKNGNTVRSIFSSLSSIFTKLKPFITAISKMLGTHAWDTFVDSISTILDLLKPILELVAGVLEILDGILNWDSEKVKGGFDKIGMSLMDSFLAPLEMILDGLATAIEAIAQLIPPGKARDEMLQFAGAVRSASDELRGVSQEVFEVGEQTEYTFDKLPPEIDQANKEWARYIDEIRKVGPTSEEEFRQMTEWANYCQKYGLDPITGQLLAEKEAMKQFGSQSKEEYQYMQKYASDSARESYNAWLENSWKTRLALLGLDPASKEAYDWMVKNASGAALESYKAWAAAGTQAGAAFADNYQHEINKRGGVSLPVSVRMSGSGSNELLNFTKQQLLSMGIHLTGFATGGYPTPGSLFWAGENGLPEMLGTVGGRTAVAGSEEITGIREAIEAQGESQNRLLSQLISTVDNKDLSLVANATTGRWVNKSLKAYAGVTG